MMRNSYNMQLRRNDRQSKGSQTMNIAYIPVQKHKETESINKIHDRVCVCLRESATYTQLFTHPTSTFCAKFFICLYNFRHLFFLCIFVITDA